MLPLIPGCVLITLHGIPGITFVTIIILVSVMVMAIAIGSGNVMVMVMVMVMAMVRGMFTGIL